MIILACDHAGFKLKEEIKKFLNNENILAIDVGTYSQERCDFPDFAKVGCQKVLENASNVGIFICGSGIGMSMVANRNTKIRAALCTSVKFANLARRHNNANVLVLPGRFVKKCKAIRIIKEFLTTDFEGGIYLARIKKF